jgi:hypothetical protein
MAQQRNLQLHTRRADATDPNSVEPEPESPLLQEARGWSGIAQEAHARINSERNSDILNTRRRNGSGQ